MGPVSTTPVGLDLTLELAPSKLTVSYVVSGIQIDAGAPLLDVPRDVVGVPIIELNQSNIAIQDDLGKIEHIVVSDAAALATRGPSLQARILLARATSGSFRVSYTARSTATKGAQPPIGFRHDRAGVSGQGWTFLLLPVFRKRFRFRLYWKTPQQQSGVTSAGVGDLDFLAGSTERVLDMFFMAGRVQTLRDGTGLAVHSIEDLPFDDPQAFIAYCGAARASLARLFGEGTPPYRVFVRINTHFGLTGSVVNGGIIVGCNREEAATGALDTEAFIDHEAVHDWCHLDGTYEESVWHNEGLAEFLGLLVPYQEQRLPAQQFLARVNAFARMAYASPLRDRPLSDIAPNYWRDPLSQREPYLRGFFYFAQLSYALNVGGHSGLIELLKNVRSRQKRGERVDARSWDSLVRSELGDDSAELLQGVLLGNGRFPNAEVWGPEFDCQMRDAVILAPGFGTSTFFTKKVDEVIPGTPAELAGLRPGDRLPNLPSLHETAAVRFGRSLSLDVERGNRLIKVEMQLGTEVVIIPSWNAGRRGPR